MKMDPPAARLLHTLLALTILPPVASVPCPRPCSCPQPAELHCTFRSLVTIPDAVSKSVERMNLGFNSIHKITDKSLAGLRKLELLMVHGNDIHTLPDGVFRDLTSLQMLKMSYNKLSEINRHTLQGLWSLARLHLDHNRLEFIHPDAFQGLTSLRLLQLEGNQLQQLHPATFATFVPMGHFHVSTLRHLYLSDNELTSLPSGLVASMPQLENLYLHGNPWTCDCNMRWLQDWNKTSAGVLKCKKDRALPGGQMCPMCSSPRHLQKKELMAVEDLVCSIPIISSPHRTSPPEDLESEVMAADSFREPFGNISLGLSDEHGNEVDLTCSIGEPREVTKIDWEQVNQDQLASNITLSVALECPVDREKYERLWRLIAYYSSVPAHLQRGGVLSEEPHPTYVYRQDSEKDALYYTGVKANIMAQPPWLMQPSADLQLNRLQSSAKMVKLILSMDLSETVDAELVRRQRRAWVMIDSTNATRTAWSATLGGPSQMRCDARGSGRPAVGWMLPDGSRVEAPYSGPDNRVSVSADGRLAIKSVSHTDAGIYYCIAKVHGDLAVLPFHLTVQESSSPPPGVDAAITPTEVFAGNPVSLPCSASGSPEAEINWILPGNNIVSSQSKSSRAVVYSNGTLHISHIQLSDSGYYKCIAINQHGVDTLVAKIAVVRRKGLIRPLRKFPARPQSASGVNTQIKVLAEDEEEEASGDAEVTQEAAPANPQDPLRRIPGGAVPGRRGIHPSRGTRRRPPVLRKPTGSQAADRKNVVEGRRINMSKSKIDPEKWADILAKIRDRNTQSTTTAPPARHTTTHTTQSQETMEGSSDGVMAHEREGPDYLTTSPTLVTHTQMDADERTTQGQGTHVTSDRYTDAHDLTSDGQLAGDVHATTEPHTMQTVHREHNASRDANSDPHKASNGEVPLPQTTSVPPRAVTLWQASTNGASGGSSSSSAFPLQGNQTTNADVDGGKAADRSAAPEWAESTGAPNVVASPNNDEEPSLSGSQIIPSANPSESETSQEGNGKYLSEPATTSPLHSRPKDTLDDLQLRAVLTTASPTTALAPKRGGPKGPTRLRQPDSRGRKGGSRKRPNRRKQKPSEPPQFTTATPANAPLATAGTAVSTPLKIDALEVTTAKSNTTVPFTGGQAASSGRLSHKESTVSRSDDEPATKPPPLPASPPKTEDSLPPGAKPLFESTSAAFPTTSPGAGHGKTGYQITESLDTVAPTTAQTLTGSPPPSVTSLVTQRARATGDLGPVPCPDDSCGGFPTATVQTAVGDDQYAPSEGTGTRFSPSLRPSASVASPTEHEIKTTSGYTSSSLITTQSVFFEGDVETEQATTKTAPRPERYYPSAGENNTRNELKVDLKETANTEVLVEALVTSTVVTATLPATTARTDPVITSREVSRVTLPQTTSTGANVGPSPEAAPQEAPTVTANQGQDRPIEPVTTTAAPRGTPGVSPTTESPDPTLVSPALTPPGRKAVKQTAYPAPSVTEIPAEDVPGAHRLPGRGSLPAGKPRIIKSNFQTLTVKAETDARLPCEAQGEPKPFLSWTKVASGASIAQNTRIRRFEVHPNGTLIIRRAQHVDGGQYLCTVQNQYGADNVVVNLVVLSQHPRVLQPRNRDVAMRLGDGVDLECQVEGHPKPRVTWVLPNRVHMTAAPPGAPLQQRVAVLGNGTLRISQAIYADRGVYTCTGSSAAGSDTVSIHLRVSALPPAIQQARHENATLPEGGAAYFHCTATGAPQPVIRWATPDGVQLSASQFVSGRNLGVFPNGTLYIQRLGPGNAGRYECSAANAVASSRRTVILTTRKNPSFSKASITSSSPKRIDVTYGSDLALDCVAVGQPNPWIIWRTPSKKLVDAQFSFDPRIKVFTNGTLTIRPVTDRDGGDYLCVARNKMGDDYVLLRVDVLTKPAKIERKQQRSDQEVAYGGDLKVDCVASGLPDPEISWALPDGTMINPVKQRDLAGGGRSRRYLVFDNGTLYFNDVGMPEEGDYTCYAENRLGKDEMKVTVKVKVATSPPRIQDKDRKVVRVSYGETVTLTCNAKGEPLPVKTWISPTNRVISPALDKYQVLDDGTLVVQKVQRFDGGNYTCIARNSAGQDHKVTRLEVLVTPPVIAGLRETAGAVRVSAVQDQRKLVDCVAKGTPAPRVMWVLPGNVILPAPYYSNRMTVHENGTLEIRSPKRTDSGQLACIARNEGGEVRLLVHLDVKEDAERPQVRGSRTDSMSLTVGNAMTLNCSFEGSAPPHVTWILPGGAPLPSGARFSKFFHKPDGSLIISNPSLSEAGLYRCLGQTPGGLVERAITLSPGRKPEINNRYNSPISVMNGETVLLHCLTNVEPLRLTWTLPSGVVLNRPQRAGRYSVLPNGTLAVQQVSVYDRGSYVCRASNEYGSSLLSASLIVIAYPPQIINGPPSVTYAKRGVAIQLNCAATGVPRAAVAWETPDKARLAVGAQPRLFGNKYLHPEGSLVIQNPTQRDAGVYRCTARNAMGTDSKATFLNVF